MPRPARGGRGPGMSCAGNVPERSRRKQKKPKLGILGGAKVSGGSGLNPPPK